MEMRDILKEERIKYQYGIVGLSARCLGSSILAERAKVKLMGERRHCATVCEGDRRFRSDLPLVFPKI